MKVVIFCGGLGTRLREETEYRPKPMVPVGGRPILWHIMKHYAGHGHREFILCLGYKGEIIKDYFRNYQWNTSDVTLRLGARPEIRFHSAHDEKDWIVTMVDTGEKTMTGGRLKRVLPFIEHDEFLLTYGDGVSNVDIRRLIAVHREQRATVTLTAVRPTGRFGELSMSNGRVTSFTEKPAATRSHISGGFFVMNRAIEPLLAGDDCVLERGPLESLAREGKLAAYQHEDFWQCMDNYHDLTVLNELWNSGRPPWKTW